MADRQVEHVDQFNRVPTAHVHDQFGGQVQDGRFALSVFHFFVLFTLRPVHVVGVFNGDGGKSETARKLLQAERRDFFAKNTRNDDLRGRGWGEALFPGRGPRGGNAERGKTDE